MSKLLLRLILLLLITHPLTALVSAQTEASTAPLMFMDSKLFDNRLSKELAGTKDTVEVEISGKVSLNSLPPRIDKWISVVGENGQLDIKPVENKARSMFGLVSTVYSFLENVRAESVFEPATRYNATIYYRKDGNGDSVIERIVFTKKKK